MPSEYWLHMQIDSTLVAQWNTIFSQNTNNFFAWRNSCLFKDTSLKKEAGLLLEKAAMMGKVLFIFCYFFQVLLPASSLLQMSTVREACCKFLMRQLHPTNCLGIRSFAGNKDFRKDDYYALKLMKIFCFHRHTCLQGTAQKISQVCNAKLSRSHEHRRIFTLAFFRGKQP